MSEENQFDNIDYANGLADVANRFNQTLATLKSVDEPRPAEFPSPTFELPDLPIGASSEDIVAWLRQLRRGLIRGTGLAVAPEVPEE